jgi:hypothetical protein
MLVTPAASWACKQAVLGDTYPISDLGKYDHIVIAKIDKSSHASEYRYKPLVSFEATVIESIKGKLTKGASFYGAPKIEQERAVCPVNLVEGGTYLLFLSMENDRYLISRFSFYVNDDNEHFLGYISQIKAALKHE